MSSTLLKVLDIALQLLLEAQKSIINYVFRDSMHHIAIYTKYYEPIITHYIIGRAVVIIILIYTIYASPCSYPLQNALHSTSNNSRRTDTQGITVRSTHLECSVCQHMFFVQGFPVLIAMELAYKCIEQGQNDFNTQRQCSVRKQWSHHSGASSHNATQGASYSIGSH